MADEEDDLWAQIYGEVAPAEEKPAAQAAPIAPSVSPKPTSAAAAVSAEAPSQPQAYAAKAEDAAVEAAQADDELDIQLDEDDDEFNIELDDDSRAEAPEPPPGQPAPSQADTKAQPAAPQHHAAPAPHRYVRPDIVQAGPVSDPAAHGSGSSRPGYSLAEVDEPSFIPGVAAASLVQRQPPKPAGPPKRWPHTSNYNVPPQGVGEGEPMLPSQAAPGQRMRLPGQTKVTTEEYKEFLGLGHGDIFDLDPDLVADAPWRMPANLEDMRAFFNYDLNPHKWREYCKRVEQYRLQYTMQRKIQTLDSSAMAAAPEIDPDLPEELRAAMAAERGQSAAPPRPANSFISGGARRGPRPPFPPRQNPSSDAIVLLGEDDSSMHTDQNGSSSAQAPPGPAPKQPGTQANAGEVQKKEDALKNGAAKENGMATARMNGLSQPRPPPGKPPPPKPPAGAPPPRPPQNTPRPPPPRPPAGPFRNDPGMMSMGMHGMPFGQMGMMGMGRPMMGHPMMGNGPMMHPMGMPGPMGPMGMQGGPHMMGKFFGPGMGGPMGGPMPGPMGPGAPPMPPMMQNMYNNMNGGWGRVRGDSLAELGITEEEFEEYAQRKPRRGESDSAEADTLAMGMDVELSRPQQAPRRGSRQLEGSSSDEEPSRVKRRDRPRDGDRPRSARHGRRSRSRERSRSRSRERARSRRH